jgi:hypothetical protein
MQRVHNFLRAGPDFKLILVRIWAALSLCEPYQCSSGTKYGVRFRFLPQRSVATTPPRIAAVFGSLAATTLAYVVNPLRRKRPKSDCLGSAHRLRRTRGEYSVVTTSSPSSLTLVHRNADRYPARRPVPSGKLKPHVAVFLLEKLTL